MKIAIYILIITLVLLNSNRTFAQLINEFDNIPFGNCLRKLDSNDLIKQKRREFDSTITRFNIKQEKIPFDFKEKISGSWFTISILAMKKLPGNQIVET
jgi:hypothetical protein